MSRKVIRRRTNKSSYLRINPYPSDHPTASAFLAAHVPHAITHLAQRCLQSRCNNRLLKQPTQGSSQPSSPPNQNLLPEPPTMAYAIPYNNQLDAFSIYHKLSEPPSPPISPPNPGPVLPALGHALAGALGSAISNILVYPLDLATKRLQVQTELASLEKPPSASSAVRSRSIFKVLQRAYDDEGPLGSLYAGLAEDMGKTILDSFLFFLLYHFLRQTRLRALAAPSSFSSSSYPTASKRLPVRDELAIGMLAGALSKLVTTPVANIVTRKQTHAQTSPQSPPASTSQIVREIYERGSSSGGGGDGGDGGILSGLAGFWAGYSATLVLTLNPSLTFLFYGALKRVLLVRGRRAAPGALAAFLLGAVSKALASAITYPFSLAKTRAQLAGRVGGEGGRQARSLFWSLRDTARGAGVGALYMGLAGEVAKGFLANGVTMMVKERIHRVIVLLYLRLLARPAG